MTRLVPSQSTVRWWLHLRPKRRRDLCWFEFVYSCTWRSTRCSRTVAALHVNAGRWIHFNDYAPRLVNRVANRRVWNFTRISYIVFPLFDPFFNVIFFTDFETFCTCLLCSPPIWIVCHTYVSGAVHTFDPIPPLRTAASRYLAPADLPSLSLCEKEKKRTVREIVGIGGS